MFSEIFNKYLCRPRDADYISDVDEEELGLLNIIRSQAKPVKFIDSATARLAHDAYAHYMA